MEMAKRKWQVWSEDESLPTDAERLDSAKVQYQGCESGAYAYYKKHGGEKAGLHVGYDIPDDVSD